MSVEVRRAGLVFRLNPETISELDAIEADTMQLIRRLEALPPQDMQRLRPIFDHFFPLLASVRNNLIIVELEFDPGQKPGPGVVLQ